MYCPKCLGTGIDINNNPCTCRINAKSFFDTVSCLDIPEQYRGVAFNKSLVPNDVDESYGNYLQSIYDKITSGKWQYHNTVIASPIGHSKTILAYSCIEVLFRNGIETFPIFDVLELKRILYDYDTGRNPAYEINDPGLIVSVPILFVDIPRSTNWDVYDAIVTILRRRVHRGNSTIFLYDGTWSELVYNDKHQILTGSIGDGTYSSLSVKSWDLIKTSKVEMQVPDNIG